MPKKETFSFIQLQDMRIEEEPWGEKKTIYATDFGKCPSGVFHALKGVDPSYPIDSESLRRMDTGKLIEDVQVEKLKSLGIFIEAPDGAQHRAHNKKYNVSGRLDALIISPTQCSPKAKKIIKRKQEIYKELKKHTFNFYAGLKKYHAGEISKGKFLEGRVELMVMDQNLYDEQRELNKELLVPDPKNLLMILELKSSNEWGFKYYKSEGQPNDSHAKQTMFYLSELRKTYPNIIARIGYIAVPYQEMLEFDVQYDERVMKDLRKFWNHINEAIKEDKVPAPAPDIIMNEKTGKWKVNYQADWCRYHDKCTGRPNWLAEAKMQVLSLNGKKTKKVGTIKKAVPKKVTKKKTAAKKTSKRSKTI